MLLVIHLITEDQNKCKIRARNIKVSAAPENIKELRAKLEGKCMDRQKCSLSFVDLIRIPIFLLWVIFSTAVYSIVCILFVLFAPSISRYIGRLWEFIFCGWGVKIEWMALRSWILIKICLHLQSSECSRYSGNYRGLKHYVSFIAKELFMIPFFGWGISAMGHIPHRPVKSQKSQVHWIKQSSSSRSLILH